MIRLELPAINVLSKTDVAAAASDGTPFDLDFYADVVDVRRLADTIRGPHRINHYDGDESGTGEEVRNDVDDDNTLRRRRRVIDLTTASEDGAVNESNPARLADSVRKSGEKRRSAFDLRYRRLNAALAEIIEDHSLVAFVPMSVSDATSVRRVISAVDRARGFVALRDH